MFQAWAEVIDAWRVRVESLVEGTLGFLAEVIITGRGRTSGAPTRSRNFIVLTIRDAPLVAGQSRTAVNDLREGGDLRFRRR